MLDLLGGADAAIALVDANSGAEVSYGALRAEAAELGRRHPGRVGPGLVLIYADNDLRTVLRLFGAWGGGQAVMLADPTLPDDIRASLEEAYAPDVVLGPGAQERRAARAGAPVAGDLALVLSTSGSTGSPKGVRLSCGAVLANARAIASALSLDPEQRAAATLPLHYTYGLSVLLSHLTVGATVVLTRASPVQRGFAEALENAGVTSLAGVPYTYSVLERTGFFDRPPASLQRMTQAGGRMPAEQVRRISERLADVGGALWVMYGQTEACARIAVLPPEHLSARLGSVGWAIPGGTLHVERDGTAVDVGDVGDVIYRGPNVMWGYCHGRQDLGRGDELHGVLRTGDLGHLDADGCLWLSGRASRFAKLAGVRVSLDDLESLATGLGDVAAVGDGDRVVLHVTSADAVAYRSVARSLARRLRLHHSLIVVQPHDELPRTPQGKVDYARLVTAETG